MLKFAYNELCTSENYSDWIGLDRFPSSMWSILYGEKDPIIFCQSKNEFWADMVGILQNLRRFQFVIDLSNCVFDKLN